MQTGSTTCYSAFISVSPPRPLFLPPTAATMASLCLRRLCMCLARAQCVHAYAPSPRQYYWQSVERMGCFNHRIGCHTQSEHACPGISTSGLNHFLWLSSYSRHMGGVCCVPLFIPPLCSIHRWDLPPGPADHICLLRPQITPTAWVIKYTDTLPGTRGRREWQREKESHKWRMASVSCQSNVVLFKTKSERNMPLD